MLPTIVTKSAGRTKLHAQKNSPHILFVGGVIGVIGGTLLACRATLKLDKTLDEIKRDIEDTKALLKPEYMHGADEVGVTSQEYYKDLGYVYTKATIRLGRLYAPAIIVTGTSIAALTGSHIQLTRRNTAVTMALAAVSKAYDDYRIRVQEELGEERELDIYRGVREEKVEIDGKKELVKIKDPNHWSAYARMFDETSPNWHKDSELNRVFVQCQQNYMNHRLKAIGHVFLNEVYDALGMERSRAGAVVGWLSDGEGDCYIDFGMFEAFNSRFINNMERSIILDFNVDGTIWDKI